MPSDFFGRGTVFDFGVELPAQKPFLIYGKNKN